MAAIGNGSTATHYRDHEGRIAKPHALNVYRAKVYGAKVYGAGRFNADLLDLIRN
ncbi:hypothetical protein WBP07_15345 [Novosphingobium sp. BL-8A]|uniref:hypothetical protein n=1 Tax=Novosphingobium sp. BL-8A TaxID=3127639 RepID=UPI003757D2D0